MSKENAAAFLQLVKSDEELAKKLAAAQSEEEIKAVVTAAGDYDFSQQEWVEAVQQEAGVELADEDLDKVAGGSFLSGSFLAGPSGG